MGGMPSVSNRLRRAKVDEYIRLIMLRLLSINTILNTTLNNLLFLCYTSLFLIRVIYLSMIAKNCLSMALGVVSFIRLRVDDISCWVSNFFPEELMTRCFWQLPIASYRLSHRVKPVYPTIKPICCCFLKSQSAMCLPHNKWQHCLHPKLP